MLRIRNVNIFMEDHSFCPGEILAEGDRILEIKANIRPDAKFDEPVMGADTEIDGEGGYVIPGLIDTHLHGCGGYDFGDGNWKAIQEIARYQASQGILAIAPATMTLPVDDLESLLKEGASYKKRQDTLAVTDPDRYRAADLIGINMEGPFISKAKKGAQGGDHILPCSIETAREFIDISEGLVRFIGIAPEENEENFEEFIEALRDRVCISLAHTNAGYACAKRAFDAGAGRVIHLFNAMSPFTHREPGVPGAAIDSSHVYMELICDGVHVSPPAVRTVFRLAPDRVVMISDSMRATGLGDGEYRLGDQAVQVRGSEAYIKGTKTIAASVTNLMEALRITVKKMHVPLPLAVAAATENAAKSAGIFEDYGSLTPGKKAHFLLLNKELEVRQIIKDGQII